MQAKKVTQGKVTQGKKSLDSSALSTAKIAKKPSSKKIQSPQALTSKAPSTNLTEEQIDKLILKSMNNIGGILKKLADR